MIYVPVFNPASYPRSYRVPTGTARGDLEVFAALASRLAATQVFASVRLGSPEAAHELGSPTLPSAWIDPGEWFERADASSNALIRYLRYSLCLCSDVAEVEERYCTLAALSVAAQTALAGSGLGGLVLPSLSRLDQGQMDLSSPGPHGRALLKGSIGYVLTTLYERAP